MRRPGLSFVVVATSVVTLAALPTVQRELSSDEQAIHVLNRLAFGPRPGDVERVETMGVNRWIERQLDPRGIPNDATERLVASAFPATRLTASQLFTDAPPPNALRRQARMRGDSMLTRADSLMLRAAAREARAVVGDVIGARLARSVASERQLEEVMVDFWLNHFTVFAGKNVVRYYLADYEREAIRPYALGNFRDLLGAVARSPAMLLYLDNAQSVADSTRPTLGGRFGQDMRGGRGLGRGRGGLPRRPARRPPAARELDSLRARMPRGLNENYARELLELHTLGVDGGYTQQDVIEVARALTGWTVPRARLGGDGFRFVPQWHDAADKRVLGHRLAAGRGIEDGEDVLNIVCNHPATARHIARKLAVRFVSDTPPAALVERAAATFTRTHGDIREVVRTIVTSDEFFSREAYRAKVKSPYEVVVSAMRALGASVDTTPRTAGAVALLGQPMYGHQAPNGWPETGEAWLNTGAILNRINFALAAAAGRIPGASATAWAGDSIARLSRIIQIDVIVERLLGGQASSATREILATGRNPLLERARSDSAADMTAHDSQGDMVGGSRALAGAGRRFGFGQPPKLTGVAELVGLALGSPEFQRR